MTHTPTPWELRQSTRLGYWFADCQQGGESYTVTKFDCDEENAAFIVRAVNSHDALVEALEAALYKIRALSEDYDIMSEYTQGKAALKLAKAKP